MCSNVFPSENVLTGPWQWKSVTDYMLSNLCICPIFCFERGETVCYAMYASVLYLLLHRYCCFELSSALFMSGITISLHCLSFYDIKGTSVRLDISRKLALNTPVGSHPLTVPRQSSLWFHYICMYCPCVVFWLFYMYSVHLYCFCTHFLSVVRLPFASFFVFVWVVCVACPAWFCILLFETPGRYSFISSSCYCYMLLGCFPWFRYRTNNTGFVPLFKYSNNACELVFYPL